MIRIDIYHHIIQEKDDRIDQILSLLKQLLNKENIVSQELDNLTQKVNDTLQVEQSAIELIEGLATQLKAIANDPAAINNLADELSAKRDALAAAVAANTPAAPAPTA
jgi:hypothetical protein